MTPDTAPNGDQDRIPTTAATVSVPVTWNDADRDAGIDWWIANATYWHDQAHDAWRFRDSVDDMQRRIDRTVAYLLHLLDGPLDAGTAMVAKAAIEGLTTPTKGGNP